jgi:hypothetical protein
MAACSAFEQGAFLAEDSRMIGNESANGLPFLLLSLFEIRSIKNQIEYLEHITKLHPNVALHIKTAVEDRDCRKISSTEFKARKEQIIVLDHLLSHFDSVDDVAAEQLVKTILEMKDLRNPPHVLHPQSDKQHSRWITLVPQLVLDHFPRLQQSGQKFLEAKEVAVGTSDAQFLHNITLLVERQPLLAAAAGEAVELAQKSLRPLIAKKAQATLLRIQRVEFEDCIKQIEVAAHYQKEAAMKRCRKRYLAAVQRKFYRQDAQ